jgi:Ring finger domain
MEERLLYKNSCNITSLINLMTIHEENTARFLRQQSTNDTNIVNLLNNVFTTRSYNIDISLNTINNLFLNDNSINTAYLTELKYNDVTNKIYTTCPISRETFTNDTDVILIKRCGHYFKNSSVIPWLRQSVVCPYCRANIITEDNDEIDIH